MPASSSSMATSLLRATNTADFAHCIQVQLVRGYVLFSIRPKSLFSNNVFQTSKTIFTLFTSHDFTIIANLP
jgi:hypothetical protein